MTYALEVDDLHVFYGDSHVLHGASITIDEGQVLALLGRNGMGKTTLVHAVAGFLRPRAGQVLVKGRRVDGSAADTVAKAGVALVPQGRRVFASLTVGEHLEVAVRDGGKDGWTVDGVCDRFPVLGQRWRQPARVLSGGEQQMLAIARALLANRPVMLMDEPSEGLDPNRVAMVADVVRGLRDRGVAILLVEQRVRFALDLADRVDVLERGRVVYRTDGATAVADAGELMTQLGFG